MAPIAALAALLAMAHGASAQTAVTLSPAVSPASGQPGITTETLTATGFPTGTIVASAVTVSLAPAAGGSSATAVASSITTVTGTTRRVAFTIPSSISVQAPTAYSVSISGTTTTNATFASSNSATLTVNPAAQIFSIAPASGGQGQTLPITISGINTTFVQGSTFASFGAGISVGGGAQGAAGPLTVSNGTTAVAQISIDPAASLGARSITVTTGTQTATLTGGFSVVGSVQYSYDSQGRLATATYVTATGSVTVAYAYDAAGNRTTVVTR